METEKDNFKYTLNVKNVNEIPFDMYDNDFTFIVNEQIFKTSRFVADLLSPTIRQLHYSDRTINEFRINIPTNLTIFTSGQNNELTKTTIKSTTEYFEEFLKLSNFKEIKLDQKTESYFAYYFYYVGNIDEFINLQQKFIDIYGKDEYNQIFENMINILGSSISEITKGSKMSEIVSKISSNFDEFIENNQTKLSVELLEMIISNDHFQIKDEPSSTYS